MPYVVRTYHIDRVLAAHGWTRISDTPRKYQLGATVLWTNRSGVRDIDTPSGELQPFIPALYAPLASATAILQLI